MNARPNQNTHWTQGLACFTHPPLEDIFGMTDGLFLMRATLDKNIGQEVILYVRDQTPFMEELRYVRPFRLMLKTGVAQNEFGPLAFLLFWVANPLAPNEAFAAYDWYLNPHSDPQVELCRRLAGQTHWHLFLVGEGGEQREFFEFENNYDLDDSLDFILEASSPIPLIDFNRAKSKFMGQKSIDDLLRLK